MRARASLTAGRTVMAADKELSAEHIVLATGGHPVVPSIPGAHWGITSDGFFELPERPESIAIVGSGYVAVELAGVFTALGSRLSMVLRTDRMLRSFEPFLGERLLENMRAEGLEIATRAVPSALTRDEAGLLTLEPSDGRRLGPFRLRALGHRPHRRALESVPRKTARGARRGGIRADRRLPADQRAGPVCDRRCDRPRAAHAGGDRGGPAPVRSPVRRAGGTPAGLRECAHGGLQPSSNRDRGGVRG